MAPIDDDTLDRLLTRHLSARLDGQLGRAETAFRQQFSSVRRADEGSAADGLGVAPLRLTGERAGTPPVMPSDLRQRFWNRPAGRIAGMIGAAVAASLATMMLLPRTGIQPPGVQQLATTRPSDNPSGRLPQQFPSPDQPAMRYVHSRTWDEGTISPGDADTAIRRLRHEQVERFRYYDVDRGAWVDVVIPKEDVELLELDTY